jgi:hypothetical protein
MGIRRRCDIMSGLELLRRGKVSVIPVFSIGQAVNIQERHGKKR